MLYTCQNHTPCTLQYCLIFCGNHQKYERERFRRAYQSVPVFENGSVAVCDGTSAIMHMQIKKQKLTAHQKTFWMV